VTNLAWQVVLSQVDLFVPAFVIDKRSKTIYKRDSSSGGHIFKTRSEMFNLTV
jgi:hypothetical protein